MIHYRPAQEKDLLHLRDLDLKCYEESPATNQWWDEVSQSEYTGCIVCCKSHVPIGMVVWERQAFKLPEFEGKVTTLHIHKLCIRKEFRGNKLGQSLLAHVHEEARKKGTPYMSTAIPEYLCIPDEPDDVSEWLNKLGFKAVLVLPAKVRLYGREYDQYLFVFKVKV